MHVIVLGAGLLGVTSAYYLQQLGHEVTVVDRHTTPCAKARGRVAPNAGALPRPVQPNRTTLGRLAATATALWRNARQKIETAVNAFGTPRMDPIEDMARLNAYSCTTARELRVEAGVPSAPRSPGLLTFYLDPASFAEAATRAARLNELGSTAVLMSAEEALRAEPALSAMREQLAGASFVADNPEPDPKPTASSLVFLCRAAGVRFLMEHTVVALHQDDGRVEQVDLVDTRGQPLSLRGDAFVMALGTGSVQHADALGIGIPLHLVREYTVTLPILEGARAPRACLQDQSGTLRISRVQTTQGDCLRISAMVRADLDEAHMPDADRFDALLRRVAVLLPGVVDPRRAEVETQLHTGSADGLPLVGKTRLRNLFVNTAPGAQGWVNACGAGKSLARIVSGLRPELTFTFTGM